MTINMIKDFTNTPGGRYKSSGKYSAEEFRENILKPVYLLCKLNGMHLSIELDGSYGYSPAFLEECFGGLVRELYDPEILNIEIKSDEEPKLIEDIHDYILDEISRLNIK